MPRHAKRCQDIPGFASFAQRCTSLACYRKYLARTPGYRQFASWTKLSTFLSQTRNRHDPVDRADSGRWAYMQALS